VGICSAYGTRTEIITDTINSCVAGATSVYSGSVTIQNWANQDEWISLNDSALSKFTGTSVCANSCIHSFDFMGGAEGDMDNGPVTFKGRYTSTTQSCTSPTSGPTDTLNGSGSGSGGDGGNGGDSG